MERLFSAIPGVLSGLETNPDVSEAMVFASWSRCAGRLLRERTTPVEFSNGRLVIAVSDITWRRHLEELCPQMLVRINGTLGQGTVKFIDFRIDEKTLNRVRKSEEVLESSKSSFGVAPALALAANAISDQSLREQFLSTAASYLAKQNL